MAESLDFLIRWGNARQITKEPTGCVNSAAAIGIAGDKLATFRRLQEKDIRTPDFQTTPFEDGVYLARARHGYGGSDIQICNGSYHFTGEFYSRYIENNREYRIHVVNGRVICVVRKYLEYPEKRVSEYVKNHNNGYAFKTPRRRLNKSRLDIAVRAVEALGLDFGAVDLIVDPQGVEYVLEVNTAPACSPRTLQLYASALAQLVREKSNDDYILHPSVDVREVLA